MLSERKEGESGRGGGGGLMRTCESGEEREGSGVQGLHEGLRFANAEMA